jgi:hypothetical protein
MARPIEEPSTASAEERGMPLHKDGRAKLTYKVKVFNTKESTQESSFKLSFFVSS